MISRRLFASVCGALAWSSVQAQLTPQFVARPAAPWTGMAFAGVTTALDIDGDADQDVMVGSQLGMFSLPTLGLLRNDGGGRFTDVSAAQLPPGGPQATVLLPFDADGDGDADVFLGGYYGTSAMLLNQGNGTFVRTPMPAPFPGFAATADFDGDGDLDLAITESNFGLARQTLWVNDGTGAFTLGTILGPGWLGGTMHPFDHDGDGDLDLLTGRNPIRLWRNDGGFVFTDIGATAIVQPPTSGSVMGIHAAGDLDGDGDVDLVVSMNGIPDIVMLQQGGVFAPSNLLPHSLSNWLRLEDVDRDGDLDVVHGPILRLSLNNGNGTFTDGASRLQAGSLYAPTFADLDGDGDVDWLGTASLTTMDLVVNRAIDLEVPTPQVGQPWPVAIASQPGYATTSHPCLLAVGLVRLAQPWTIPGLGDLWVDPAAAALFGSVVPMARGKVTFAFQMPAAPQLVGLPLHLQGLVDPTPSTPRFTAAVCTEIH